MVSCKSLGLICCQLRAGRRYLVWIGAFCLRPRPGGRQQNAATYQAIDKNFCLLQRNTFKAVIINNTGVEIKERRWSHHFHQLAKKKKNLRDRSDLAVLIPPPTIRPCAGGAGGGAPGGAPGGPGGGGTGAPGGGGGGISDETEPSETPPTLTKEVASGAVGAAGTVICDLVVLGASGARWLWKNATRMTRKTLRNVEDNCLGFLQRNKLVDYPIGGRIYNQQNSVSL